MAAGTGVPEVHLRVYKTLSKNPSKQSLIRELYIQFNSLGATGNPGSAAPREGNNTEKHFCGAMHLSVIATWLAVPIMQIE